MTVSCASGRFPRRVTTCGGSRGADWQDDFEWDAALPHRGRAAKSLLLVGRGKPKPSSAKYTRDRGDGADRIALLQHHFVEASHRWRTGWTSILSLARINGSLVSAGAVARPRCAHRDKEKAIEMNANRPGGERLIFHAGAPTLLQLLAERAAARIGMRTDHFLGL